MDREYRRNSARVAVMIVTALLTLSAAIPSQAQDIRTTLTVFDNISNSGSLSVGINPAATDGIDLLLGEVMLAPPPPAGSGIFDVRLIDTDLRSPSLLGDGVLLDLRGIYGPPPFTSQHEVRVRRSSFATNTYMSWNLPLQVGITGARLVSWPDTTLLDVNMAAVSQVVLPAGAGRFMVRITYGGPSLLRHTLTTLVDPIAVGSVTATPSQADYAAGTPVLLTAVVTDTCWRFSHWSGDVSGSNASTTVVMNADRTVMAHFVKRTFPVTIGSLAPFVVNPTPPPPQNLMITNSGLACHSWTASASEPWITLGSTAGTGDASIPVGINAALLPCPGTHQGLITITSDVSIPATVTVPVTVYLGSPAVTARTLGAPVLLGCQPRAQDLIVVTIANAGAQPITFPNAPTPGTGFVLKNPAAFPLTVNPNDSAQVYFEFAPAAGQSGVITDNMVLNASTCGHQVLMQVTGTRVAPALSADASAVNFGDIHDCIAEPLPTATIHLRNNWTGSVQLRYSIPAAAGVDVTSGPATLAGGATGAVVLTPQRTGSGTIADQLTIEADYGVCIERTLVNLSGERLHAAFVAEAASTPGSLPPQTFDSTCVGGYSPTRTVRLINTGTSDLTMTLAVAPPFEIEGFGSTFTLAAGAQHLVNLRFHPTVRGSFAGALTINANHCSLSAAVMLSAATFDQQVLTSTVAPAAATLGNCDSSARIKVSIVNNGTSPATFTTLPALPAGFQWDGSLTLPVIIAANPATPFEAFITFRPPIGEGGQFGGSVQWFGEPCGTGVYFALSGERALPQVTVSALDTFLVATGTPIPQALRIGATSGGACYRWRATTTTPWIVLSKSTGTGDDSTLVSILTSAIPCQGTHAGSITITLEGLTPVTFTVPVIAVVGHADLAVTVTGSPVILGCQTRANDLIAVTVTNNGGASVMFPTAPVFGAGFQLKNPSVFPLTVAAKDSATFFVEFTPNTGQRGLIVDNTVLSTGGCGSDLLIQLTGTRIAPMLTTDVANVDFDEVLACAGDSLATRTVTIMNAFSVPVQLRYTAPKGLAIVSAPSTIAAGASGAIVLRPVSAVTADLAGALVIEGDYTVCVETITIPFEARVRIPALVVEAVDAPGTLPPQVFDTTCVGAYSRPRAIRIRNTGSSMLRITVALPAPFETDAYGSLLSLPPGGERVLSLRFHPDSVGAYTGNLVVSADQCGLASTVQLRGVTSAQQMLSATVTPPVASLINCESDARILLSVRNTGSSAAIFSALPKLPTGFFCEGTPALPIVIPADSTKPWEMYLRFAPPAGGQGTFGGSVNWFGEPCGTTVYFTLTGERIQPRVLVAPASVDFGIASWCDPTATTGVRRTITIANNSPLPMLVTAAAPASRYALYLGPIPFPQSGAPLAAGNALVMDVEALPWGGGRFLDSLFIATTAGTSGSCTQRYAVALTGERYRPAFVIRELNESPDFGDVCLQSSQIRTYAVENVGDKVLALRAVALDPASPFQFLQSPLLMTLRPSESAPFRVRFAPALQGAMQQVISFISDACPDTIRFMVKGRGVQPAFAVDSIMPAGPVTTLTCERPGQRQITITVRNTGPDPVIIADAGVPPAGFAFDPPGQFPFRMQPGETHDVTMRFVAVDPGRYSGLVTLRSAACDASASFALQAVRLDASFDIPRRDVAFGDITICADGEVRPADQDRLLQTLILRNTGEVPMLVRQMLTPQERSVTIVTPGQPQFMIAPGMTQMVTLGLLPPIDSTLGSFNGTLDLVIARDSTCPLEYVSIPWSGRVLHMGYRFLEDSILTDVRCITRPLDVQARLVNTGTASAAFTFGLVNAAGFTLSDSSRRIVIPAGEERSVTVRYTPDSARTVATATLVATDESCSLTVAIPIRVTLTTPTLTAGMHPFAATPAMFEARPGDVISVPVFIDSTVACATGATTMYFDLQFDVFALAPLSVSSPQGQASLHRVAPDRAVITIAGTSMLAGEIARVNMEVLVGRSAVTTFTLSNARVTPPIARIDTAVSATATLNVLPRNGITTLEDLGITTIKPPRPNLITGRGDGTTTISIEVAEESFTEITLCNQLGIVVSRIHSGPLSAGTHTFELATDTLPNGVYLVTCRSGRDHSSEKLILAR